MAMLGVILVFIAFVLALLQACRAYLGTWPAKPHLGWLAMAVYFLSLLLTSGGIRGCR